MTEPVSMNWKDISVWRKAQREQWIAWRCAIPEAQRAMWGERMTALLCALLPAPQQMVIGFCWPFKAEFDARFAVHYWREQGAVAALPEVTGKGQPLRFSQWWPGAPMKRGVYDIPVPDGTPDVLPDIAIVPMNAFDGRGFRLGYGGGYFDRTLAALERRVVAIGVTWDACRVTSIFPQAHDIAMDLVVTEAGIYGGAGESQAQRDGGAGESQALRDGGAGEPLALPDAGGGETLQLLDAAAAVAQVQNLLLRRDLPRANGK